MTLNLTDIGQTVTSNLSSQAISTNGDDSPSAPTTPVEPTIVNAEQEELARLRQENAELKQRQLETERDARIKTAIAATHVQDSGPSNGEQAVRRQRAIAES